MDEKQRFQERREELQSKVRTFHQQGIGFVPLDAPTVAPSEVSAMASDSGESDDDEGFFMDNETEWEEDEDVETPIERAWLGLPSSFDAAVRSQMGIVHLAGVETELREGQANDALESLRAGLAEKSLRFRTEVKPAKSHKKMTRGDSVHRADVQIKVAVQSYHLARSALQRLGAGKHLLDQFQEIQKKDLKMSGDIVEENRVGQRSSELAWFWRLDQKRHVDRGEFLKECRVQLCFIMATSRTEPYQFIGLIG